MEILKLIIYLKSIENIKNLTLTNSIGQIVLQHNHFTSKEISIDKFQTGVYFVTVESSNGVIWTRKFVQ